MKQKLVTIYFDSEKDAPKIDYLKYGPQEHLSEYLESGWKIIEIQALNGSGRGPSGGIGGWLVVLLQHASP